MDNNDFLNEITREFVRGQQLMGDILRDARRCTRCNETGITQVPNGPDDFDEEYCGCAAGEALESKEINYGD